MRIHYHYGNQGGVVEKRNTKQREAIREVFLREMRPLSPTEVLSLVQEDVSTIGIATIYRALKKLVDGGWLVPLTVGGSTRYERSEMGHHHHFHCEECDRTFDIKGCVGDLSKMVPEAFKILSHELTIIGMCRSCNGAPA